MYYNQRMNNELYHYGILGMKWGHRRAPSKGKLEYKSAAKSLAKANRAMYKSSLTSFGYKKLNAHSKKVADANRAELNMINKKAAYKASKAKTRDKAAKKEFKTYTKEMRKSGLAGSAKDQSMGGRSTRLYNELSRKKGKEYADKVAKKVQNKVYTQIAIGSTVAIGSLAAQSYINRKYAY